MSDAAWSLQQDGDVLSLVFVLPGESVNVLRHENMAQLDELLDEAARRPVRALLVESGKSSGFIAGADIHAIAGLKDASKAEAAARTGQAVFAKLSALPFPSVALIHGACVGGGLELALACTLRVAAQEPGTQLALPEVQLGILPGFGGTQRLPALLGLLPALPLILTGKRLGARAARRLGLVDDVAPGEALRAAALRLLRSPRRFKRPRRGAFLETLLRFLPPLRQFVLSRARKGVLAKTHGLYPAPLKILDAVEAGYKAGGRRGYEVEARLLAELATSEASRSLVRLFLLAEKARDVEKRPALERAAVAGAGTMGAGIAGLFASSKIRTRLYDVHAPSLEKGMQGIAQRVRTRARRRGEGEVGGQTVLDRLEPTLELVGLGRTEVFLEAVLEKMEVKKSLFREVQKQLPAGAWLATNTSSLDLDEMAQALDDPTRLVGVHFFNPVHRMRLVEVVRAQKTAAEVVQAAKALVRQVGKVPVVVSNAPGFLVNRLLTPYLLEAEKLVEEGVTVTAVDRLAIEAGMPMGPLELLDEIGLDVARHVAETMQAAFPERFQPGGLVVRLVESGALGKKNGRGFYVYGRRRKVNSMLLRSSDGSRPTGSRDEWRDRLILPVVAEGLRCLDEGVIESEEDIDLAMQLGTGFQLPFGGPMRAAATRGMDEVHQALVRLEQSHGARFAPPEVLSNRIRSREKTEA